MKPFWTLTETDFKYKDKHEQNILFLLTAFQDFSKPPLLESLTSTARLTRIYRQPYSICNWNLERVKLYKTWSSSGSKND